MTDNENQQTLADFIRDHAPEHRRGTKALHELVQAVRNTGKAGTVTFTVKLEPDKRTVGALLVSNVVAKKIPELDPPQRVVWYQPSGELVDHDPAQPPIPGLPAWQLDADRQAAASSPIQLRQVVFNAAPDQDEDTPDPVLVAKMKDQADNLARFAQEANSGGVFTQEPVDQDEDGGPAGIFDQDGPDHDEDDGDTLTATFVGIPRESTVVDEPVDAPQPGDDLPMVDPDDYDTGTAMALADAVNVQPSNVHQISDKPKRKRRTKAEMEAARAEEARTAADSQA